MLLCPRVAHRSRLLDDIADRHQDPESSLHEAGNGPDPGELFGIVLRTHCKLG